MKLYDEIASESSLQGKITSNILNCRQEYSNCLMLYLLFDSFPEQGILQMYKKILMVVMCAEINILLAGSLIYISDQRKFLAEHSEASECQPSDL